jgi:hypothetical protein
VSEHCVVSSLLGFEPENDSMTITSIVSGSVVTLTLVLGTFYMVGNCKRLGLKV